VALRDRRRQSAHTRGQNNEGAIPASSASGLWHRTGPRQLNLADQYLAQTGIQRRIDVTVESFLLVPFLIQGTELVSHVLERAAKRLTATTNIRLMESPFDLPDIHEAMYWHLRHTTDP
jgi:hypothetical protein